MPTTNEKLVATVRGALPGLIAFYAFGSVAEGTARADSDLDLALLATGPVEASLLSDLRGQLEEIARREVDLIDLWSASTVFRMQVITTGKTLHVEDEAARVRFEDVAFSMYARLNEERQAILDQVSEEGRVYGR